MKYVIVIPDGGADLPLPELDDRTPFQAARTPTLDAIARAGTVGSCATTPPGFGAGSDVCTMSLLGYDPGQYHTGRAPLEAAALGLDPAPTDWIFRLNLVTVGEEGRPDAGAMLDHSAGGIPDDQARPLLSALADHWNATHPDLMRAVALHPGVSYRSIVIDASGRSYAETDAAPPHEIPGEPWRDHLPTGPGDAPRALRTLIESSHEFLRDHPVNAARRAASQRPANLAWLWGQGTRPSMPSFELRFAVRGAMLTSVDLLRGIARLIGWDLIDCPGLTSYHDTDYAAQGRATIAALDDYDVVCCHVEAPDEASHQADWQTKVASLESIDREILAPLHAHLTETYPAGDSGEPGWRLLVLPDHYTLCSTRKHDPTPVPFSITGRGVHPDTPRELTERHAESSSLRIDPGHDLVEHFLFDGLKTPR